MKISIVVLIYKSTEYADFIYNQVKKYTPEEHEFFFVANDATNEVKKHLRMKGYPYKEFFKIDNCTHYLQQVYAAWNFGVASAEGDIVVLLNSDMGLSKDWLSNLLKWVTPNNAISSRLIESGRMPSGTHALSLELGMTPTNYQEEKFIEIVEKIKQDRIKEGGLYSPVAFYRNTFLTGGGYPHGNLIINNIIVPGDILFWTFMKTRGIIHYTAFDSIVYHFQEGEMRA